MTKGQLLRSSLMFALQKVKLAGYKLSDWDVTNATEDAIAELRKYGTWKELDEEIEPAWTGDR